MRLKNKIILVTGGSKGIGKGIAQLSAQEGAHVVIADIDKAAGEALVAGLQKMHGRKMLFVCCDLSQSEQCRDVVNIALNEFGRIDGLVNNAGCYPRATITETEEALFDKVFDVNIKGAFFCSRYVIEAMLRQTGGGSIVHLGSTHGFGGAPELAAYACAKGAMHTLSRHIADNYASKLIRSNWITVGWVVTEGEAALHARAGISIRDLQSLGATTIPSGRLQTAEDMAWGAIYLLSDEATQVTGTDLHITGGFNI